MQKTREGIAVLIWPIAAEGKKLQPTNNRRGNAGEACLSNRVNQATAKTAAFYTRYDTPGKANTPDPLGRVCEQSFSITDKSKNAGRCVHGKHLRTTLILNIKTVVHTSLLKSIRTHQQPVSCGKKWPKCHYF